MCSAIISLHADLTWNSTFRTSFPCNGLYFFLSFHTKVCDVGQVNAKGGSRLLQLLCFKDSFPKGRDSTIQVEYTAPAICMAYDALIAIVFFDNWETGVASYE